MVTFIKKKIKKRLFKRKNIDIDDKSNLNIGVQSSLEGAPSRIIDSNIIVESMGYDCFIEHINVYGRLLLGNCVSISGPGTILHAEIGRISIGSYTSIAENVSIQEFNHIQTGPTTSTRWRKAEERTAERFTSKGDILIEEDVWIGSNVVILSGVTIGRGAIIGAGSIVTKDVPRYAVVVGNPGRVLRYRFKEHVIRFLEELQWWMWEEEKVRRNHEFFKLNLEELAPEQLPGIKQKIH